MENPARLKRIAGLVVGAVILVVLALLLRGPHISNALKRLILPELESALGKEVIAQKIYINLFPLFIEARDLKAFDESGQRLFSTRRVKAYVNLSGFLRKTVTIRRLVIKEPYLNVDEEQARQIEKSLREYLSRQRKDALTVKVLVVELQGGKAHLRSEGLRVSLSMDGLQGEAIIDEDQRIRFDAPSLHILREGLPEITIGASVRAVLKGSVITLQKAVIESFGSRIEGTGDYEKGRATIRTSGDLLVATFKKIFRLKERGDGEIRINGEVSYAHENLSMDLSLSGSLYLESLMELLKVEERLEGLMEFKGKIHGALRDITAQGSAVLKQGNLYDVEVDSLACKVFYEKGVLRFVDGVGSLYRGKAKASASITLPTVNHFALDIDFANADSRPLFKLIGWDPGIPAGKVTGTLHHAGGEFNPKGVFAYTSSESGADVLGRVKTLDGTYDLNGDLLTLTGIRLKTALSEVTAGGTVDIEKETLNLTGELKTPDVTDLTAPYFGKLRGTGGFHGSIHGTFQDPVIEGRVTLSQADVGGFAAGTITSDLIYRKDLLQVKEMRTETPEGTHLLSGSISFTDAEGLFDLSHPVFRLKATLKNADIGRFVKIFYPEFDGTGRFTSSLKIEGTGRSPEVRADVLIEKAVIYRVPIDSASCDFAYLQSRLEFRSASVRRGDSQVQGSFTIYPDDTFSFTASSERVRLSDLIQRPIQGELIAILTAEGKGTFDNPSIAIDAKVKEGVLRGKEIGTGLITASVKEKEFRIRASLIDDKISLIAKGSTEGVMPWEATADIRTGRYDFLITSILKDVPEDLILSLNGNMSLHGTRNHIEGSAVIKHMVLSMYGYTFTSEEEIGLDLKDRELRMGKIALRSGNTILRTGGSLIIGRSYNITVEGSSALSPFKSLSAKLGVLKGDAEFVVGITGDWDSPTINGSINLGHGAISLKEYPAYRITDLRGYLYMDNDRVVLESLKGKIGGGDIGLSGVLYLKKFRFSRFYVESNLENISASPSTEFTVNFGGNILYKGTPEKQMVSGNIDINRARYRERIEWKSWLLQTKQAEKKIKSEISNLEKAELNVKITGRDNIVIDNNVARAVVGADMVLRGTIYRPALIGRIESREGTVYFRNNEFKILHASADFADPKRLNPFVSIAAETVVKSYKIKLNLEGQLDRFDMSLSSDPPLKEMDVLALLTVGQRGGELKGLEGGIGAGEATSFVTGALQDVVEERVRSITGLDRIQIDPNVSKKTGAVEPRVTVSKRLLSDKLYVTYSSPVTTNEEQIVKIEYFMGKNVSLVGLRDERGIIGGDVRFRFEFK